MIFFRKIDEYLQLIFTKKDYFMDKYDCFDTSWGIV
jgi:hypothetical protein